MVGQDILGLPLPMGMGNFTEIGGAAIESIYEYVSDALALLEERDNRQSAINRTLQGGRQDAFTLFVVHAFRAFDPFMTVSSGVWGREMKVRFARFDVTRDF